MTNPHDKANGDDYWYTHASEFFGLGGTLRQRNLFPTFLNVAGDLQGKRVLDFGSGDGELAAQFAKAGAQVLGIDKSPDTVQRAISHHGTSEQLRFEHVDPANYATALGKNAFDLAVLSLLLSSIPSQKESIDIFSLLTHVIKPGGRLLIGDTHPCFAHYRFSNVEFKLNPEHYRIDCAPYDVLACNGFDPNQTTLIVSYHRPLERVAELVYNANFLIRRLHEVYDSDANYLHPDVRNYVYDKVPAILVIDAIKADQR